MRPLAPALALILATVAGCAEPPAADEVVPSGAPVAFRTLLHQLNAEVLRASGPGSLHAEGWNQTWEAYAAGIEPPPPRPFADFEREQVAAVTTGQHGSGCHDVRVTNVTRRADEVVVWYVTFDGESASTACTGQIVWPTHVVAIADAAPAQRFVGYRTVGANEPWERVEPAVAPANILEPRPLAKGSFSGIHDDTRVLLRDAGAWETLWREHRAGEPLPSVDFAREMVVAVVVHGPTGCAAIHLGEIVHHPPPRVVTVEVLHDVAPPNVNCLVAFQDVFEFVAVPALEAAARFFDVEDT